MPPSVKDTLGSPGVPLEAPVRRDFEGPLRADFADVRVHTDPSAAASARDVGARAYTVGNHVVFGPGGYPGRRPMAHELTHVLQQRAASPGDSEPQQISASHGASERAAEATADQLMPAAVQRQTDAGTPDAGTPDAGPTAAGTADAGTTDAGTAACALTTFTGSDFVGEAVTADVEFVDSLNAINGHAVAAGVDLHVTSSFRTSTVVPGAIVTPATMSNHLAGHAIDMNVLYGASKSTWCNSACLGGTQPAAVQTFIDAVKGDAGLRWGGDFTPSDPVHIDDGLNVNDATGYTARHQATQQARTSGCG